MQALPKGARITGSQRSELARRYAERYAGGESIRSIAVDSGRSFGFVHGVLSEAGVELRGRGGATRGGTGGEAATSQQQAPAAAKKKAATTKTAKAAEGVRKAAKKATTKTAKAPAAKKTSTTKTASAPAVRKRASTTKTA